MNNKKGFWPIGIGLLLIAVALCLALYNQYDSNRAGKAAENAVEQLEKYYPEKEDNNDAPDYISNPDIEMPVKTVDGTSYIGVIYIPKLELKMPVINEWSYSNLKTAPCRYSGSVYKDNMVIAAHNYISHFGKLKKMREGDAVSFTDMDGNLFSYTVSEQEILSPDAVDEIKNSDCDLTLFTCTFDSRNRVVIRCVREKI